ncbi:MAG: hypothetical protein LQ352_002231 [Teloschistes flavicans]|nr:MAG: hypothetical protein LQ352_002231 [Teloschistes flavicans]
MLDGLFMLLTLSTVMAIASFLAGSLPLSFALSQSRLQLISTIGMGVLVGTSLIVIIPEGVDTLYSASEAVHHTHTRRNLIPLPLDVRWQQQPSVYSPLSARDEIDPTASNPFGAMPGPILPEGASIDSDPSTSSASDPPRTPTEPGKIGILEAHPSSPSTSPSTSPLSADTKQPSIPHASQPSRTPHAWIGISLILGFILMYLLDTLPLLAPQTSPSRTQNIYSLSDLSSSSPTTPMSLQSTQKSQRTFSTTLGLVIHAAADGIALGASHSSGSSTGLGFIIFLAIMIHKAPAAFGLTSVLLKQGLGKRSARAHLVVFSLAAPAGAVGTWLIVRMLGGGGGGGGVGEEMSTRWWTGVLLLFSGGTFLYVAMHTMQENDVSGVGPEEAMGGFGNGYLDGAAGGGGLHRRDSRQGGKQGRSLRLVAAAVGGMLLPLITQIGHAH